MQDTPRPAHRAAPPRVWYPFPFVDRQARAYRVSFLIAEEATWDHCFHDLDGREIPVGELKLLLPDHRFIQESCDHAVGSPSVLLMTPAANGNDSTPSAHVDALASPG